MDCFARGVRCGTVSAMKTGTRLPCALTIAGSDSGGGAGIQADLKAFAAIGVHGTSAITCLTAQNPGEVRGVQPTRRGFVRLQLETVCDALRPVAAKSGMLYSAAIIREVAEFLEGRRRPLLVVDPVMIATSGAWLIRGGAMRAMQERLFPRAALVTPNLDEAVALTGMELATLADLQRAARVLRDQHGCAVLVKGGHLPGPKAVDVFWDGRTERVLSVERVRGVSTHGTGCTYSAAIAAYLARGCRLEQAVVEGKRYITESIRTARRVGKGWVLGWGTGSRQPAVGGP